MVCITRNRRRVKVLLLTSVLYLFLVVAFLIALYQNKQLLGRNGLLPIHLYLQNIRENIGSDSSWKLMSLVPTLFWWIPEEYIDISLDSVATVGLVVSGTMVFLGAGNVILFFILWGLYQSLSNVGQRWLVVYHNHLLLLLFITCRYSFGKLYLISYIKRKCRERTIFICIHTCMYVLYVHCVLCTLFDMHVHVHVGWESQLLEMGFLAMFLSPVLSLSQFPHHTPTSLINVWGNRWMIFRIMIGAVSDRKDVIEYWNLL